MSCGKKCSRCGVLNRAVSAAGVEGQTVDIHQLIDVIVEILNERDAYTFQHSYRVAEYAVKIAESMFEDDETVERIHLAAHLHDIGKIGIPDTVLNKPGKLSPEDMALMQSHSRKGFHILNRIPLFKNIARIVLHHHERYDGQGYPDGLKGTQIPIESRVIAVADAFDAMTSHRTYRKGMGMARALKEINAHGGDQFDPGVVEHFNRIAAGVSKVVTPAVQEVLQLHEIDHDDLMHSMDVSQLARDRIKKIS